MKRQTVRKAVVLVSFLLFPVTIFYLSPYIIVQGLLDKVIAGSYAVFAALFLSSLFLGRLFCGWVCPAGGLQEACFSVNSTPITKGDWIKWLIWIPWISLIVWLTFKSLPQLKMEMLYMIDNGISITHPGNYVIFYAVVGLIVILSFAVGKRSFCHHVCWMAPFMMVGRWIRNRLNYPSLHLYRTQVQCTHCHTCTAHCPMSLDVETLVRREDMEHPECILCGTCVDGCRQKVIDYGWINKKRGEK